MSDPADPRLADYIGLTDVALRRRKEPAEGIFIAEGEKVIERALAAGYPLRSALLEEKWLHTIPERVWVQDSPVYVADRELLEQVTGYAVHRGALAAMNRIALPEVQEVIDGACLLMVLENINNHTNIGAIFRSAAALGADGVLLSPTCADPLYRRSVRVSMGSVFALPYAKLATWPGPLAFLRDSGFTVLALSPSADARAIDDVPRSFLGRCALLLGAEGPGLTTESAELADLRVRIPMSHGIDSLNVAAAAAVACYAVATSRGSAPHGRGKDPHRPAGR